ncbi:MAG: hypothetical protein V5B78_05420 [Desulfohalobiaceae bacterium]
MRTLFASTTIGLLILLLCSVAWSAGPTMLSEATERLEKGMKLETVTSILGEPTWVILDSDSGKYSLKQPPDQPNDTKVTFELLWKNGECSPVSVYFTQYYTAVGWDSGQKCGEDATKTLPEEYSCEHPDRSRYCRQ